MKENQTRFVLIGKNEIEPKENSNKATLKFELSHDPGSLANTLQLFTTFNINLTKIQSLPIVGRPWQYAFFVDVMFEDHALFLQVIDVLKKAVTELKILGVYTYNMKNVPSQLTNILINGKH